MCSRHSSTPVGANATIVTQNPILRSYSRRGERAGARHVLHDSVEANSLLRPESPGNAIQAVATPKATEPVYRKHVNSAFIGTSLEKDLRHDGIDTLVLVGLTTNHLRFDFGPDGRQSRVHHFRGFRCDCGFRAGSVGWNGAFRGCCTFCGSQRSSPGIRNHC